MKSVSKIIILITLFCISHPDILAAGSFSWSSGQFKIDIAGNKLSISENKTKLVTLSSIDFNFSSPRSIFVASQSKEKLLLTFTYPPEVLYRSESQDLNTIVEITVSDHTVHFSAAPKWATNCTLHLEDSGEHYFGVLEPLVPGNNKSPDLRGEVLDVEIIGNGNLYNENYASAWSAFYMTNKGYASFFDSFARGKYKLGVNGETELFHQTGKLDWYLFTGKNGDEILKAYYTVIGKPKFVPMWACGPIAWRDENKFGKDEVLDDIQKMTNLKIPFTAWFVDRPYSHGANEWSKMDFNDKFSDPQDWIATIRNTYGMELMTWVGPMTFGDQDFPAYQFNPEGYFDLSHPDAVKEFGRRLKAYQYSVGVRGHKMDRADQDFPSTTPWYDKTPEPERRNKYLYLYSTTIDSLLRDAWAENQMNFARSAYHRCQPFLSALWGGDSRSTWDGMAANLANAMRCSYMGFPVWGSDVGGYLGGNIPEDLYARWLQLGTWSGLFEIKLDDAGGKGEDRVPWKYSQRLQSIFREYNGLRMELQPFFFSLANTSYKNGVLMKPLAYLYPDDKKTYSMWNEFQVGNTFLVAPVLDSISARNVYLPRGTWYDFYDNTKTFEGNTIVEAAYPLEMIPVYIRANSIYVSGAFLPGNSRLWNVNKPAGRLNIHAFPGRTNESIEFDYVDCGDGNKEKQMALSVKRGSITFVSPSLSSDALLRVKLDSEPSTVLLNGASCKYQWNEAQGILKIDLKKNTKSKVTID
jgi:alpha-glucosidase (family GH31 glycosyl hydrolase)